MAKSRSIRDFTDSDSVAALSAAAERFFVRLLLRADDYGNINANIHFLKRELFPVHHELRTTDISLWIKNCLDLRLIGVYAHAGKELIHIYDHGQKLRWPQRKYPPAPFESVLKEKVGQKEKEVEEELELEGEGISPPPVEKTEMQILFEQCEAYLLLNKKLTLAKYFRSETQLYERGYAALLDGKLHQDEFQRRDDHLWKFHVLMPMRNEFEKFWDYYTAKGWEGVSDKFAQWKVWLKRKIENNANSKR